MAETRSRWIASAVIHWTALIAACFLAIHAAMQPPAPVPADAAPTAFSSARAMTVLRSFAQRPHPLGSEEHARVRATIVQQLQALGLQPQLETWTGTTAEEDALIAGRVSNIVARMPGTNSTRAVVLTAHYDSVEWGPGAGDDGAGVATILETLRALKAGPPLKNDVVALITDGEEDGLLGAQAAAVHDAWLRDPGPHGAGVVFNFEGRGDTGPSLLFETSDGNRALLRQFTNVAPAASGDSLAYALYKLLPNDTDFTVFKRIGLAGLNFAWDARLEAYHSRMDTTANLNPRSLQQDGDYALGLTRAFGDLDLNAFPLHSGQDEIFFNWFGTRMVAYSAAWVMPLFFLATVILFTVAVRAFQQKSFGPTALIQVVAASLLVLAIVPLVMFAGWWCVQHWFGPHLSRGDTPSNAALLLALVLLGSSAGIALAGFFRAKLGAIPLSAGGLLLVWTLTAALTWFLPAGSHLLLWPLLFAGLTLGIVLVALPRPIGLAGWIAAVPLILLFAPAVDSFFIGLQFSAIIAALTGFMVAIALFLLVPMLELLAPAGRVGPVSATILLAGILALGAGFVMSRPSARHPRPDSLVFHVDAGSRDARWVSYDAAPDNWTALKLGTSPQRTALASLWSNHPKVLWTPATGGQSYAAPTLAIDSSVIRDGVRSLHVQLQSPRDARRIFLRLAPGEEIVSATIEGETAKPDSSGKTAVVPITSLFLFGYGDQPVNVTLVLRGTGCHAELSDATMGLPGVSPRPEDRIAPQGSDETIVTRKIDLCP